MDGRSFNETLAVVFLKVGILAKVCAVHHIEAVLGQRCSLSCK